MNPLADLIGASPRILALRETVGRLLTRHSDARRIPPILIQGETGVGKGLIARAIHRAGPRSGGPFVDVNCAAIPETLLEAEMFGYERGAFTDARQAKPGLFQTAHRGTIFLDEVGLLPGALQSKLLKAIEERAVRRLGSTRNEPVDVWIVTATSENLVAATRARRFREDLYHRLAVVTLWLPPLRERGPDILLLAEHYLARACADYDLPPKELGPTARAALLAHPWPGNVRELANVMERVVLLTEGAVVTAEMLGLERGPAAARSAPEGGAVRLHEAVGTVERDHLLEALRDTDWNISRAAARLGIPRNTMRYRVEKHGLRPDAASGPPRRRSDVAPTPEASPPADAGPAAPLPAPTGVRWERRRLALLRVVLIPPPAAADPADPSRALAVLVEKAQGFGARIMELGATALVAAFGLEPVEDAVRRAAHAAIAIKKASEHEWGGRAASFRVKGAIYAGQFVLGRLGATVEIAEDSKRPAWTRLEALVAGAETGSLLIDEAAASFLERRFELAPIGAVGTAGRAYRLGRQAGVGFARRLGRFVGRVQELDLLRNRLAAATRDQGQAVGIVGEAGIGKSRLVFEFRQGVAGQDVTYLEGHCASYASAIPYMPLLDLLRRNCSITDADSPETIRAKVRRSFEELGMDPEERAAYVLHLLGSDEVTTSRLEALTPDVIKARTFETLQQMSLRGSRRRPIILVVEDLHWVDKTSEEYLNLLVESLARSPILFVATYRPGYRPPWMEKSYTTQIALPPLAPDEGRDVVRSVLGGEAATGRVEDLIVTRGEGNPFFLEELARTAREQGGLMAVPDTVEDVILARIDRLSPESKQVLQCAAVMGKDVHFALAQAIAELPEDVLRRSLLDLQSAEFLYEIVPPPELEYTFKHPLTHEVAYESLFPEHRRVLHARIAEAIEHLHPGQLTRQIERLAHHALYAEVWEKALDYSRQAGQKALARSAHREAVAWFERALSALQRLPETRERLALAIDLRFDLRNSLYPLGELGPVLDHLRAAETLAAALDDQRRLGRVSSYLLHYFGVTSDPDRAIECGQRALALAEVLEDFALQVEANFYLGQVYEFLGDYRRAIGCLRRNVASLEGDLIRERFGLAGLPSVFSRNRLVWCLAELGEFTEGIAIAAEGARIAEAVDHPFSLIAGYLGVGRLYLRKGELHRASEVLERGLHVCRDATIPALFPMLAAHLGCAYVLSGRVAEGLPLLEEAVEQAAATGITAGHSLWVAWQGEAYLLAGRLGDAELAAGRAIELCRRHKEQGHQAWSLRLLGEIASRSHPPEVGKAEDHYHQAIARAGELGMRPLIAHCHLGLGTVYSRIGRLEPARSALSAAVGLYRAMGMTFWLPRAEAQLVGDMRPQVDSDFT